MDNQEIIKQTSIQLLEGIAELITLARKKVAVYLNAETTLLYYGIGHYINNNLKANNRMAYGAQILATLSQQLTLAYGKGYTYTGITRMCKVAGAFEPAIVATLSQQLGWSHFIELAAIENPVKKNFMHNFPSMKIGG